MSARAPHPLKVSAILALALLPFNVTANAAAQGLRAGIVSSELTGAGSFDSRTGLVLGAGFVVLSAGPVDFAPEFLYAQFGGSLPEPTGQAIDDVRIDYFQIPLLVRVGSSIPGAEFLTPSLHGGIYYAFETKCSFGFADGGDRSTICTLEGNRETGVDGVYRDTDMGWAAGAGLAVSTRYGNFQLEARHARSLRSITVSGSVDDAKNRAWLIMLGWSPDIGGMIR